MGIWYLKRAPTADPGDDFKVTSWSCTRGVGSNGSF
jgi:hypothetical protein